jgi:hypothetical protein
MDRPQDHADTTELVARALAPYSERPSPEDVALLVDDLIACGQKLLTAVTAIPKDQQAMRATESAAEWEYFATVGPLGSGLHANWNHARALARIVQRMVHVLEQRPTPSAL